MRCEGYRKLGSFMTFGPREWVQCEHEAVVMIKFIDNQDGSEHEGKNEERILPACMDCWQDCIDHHLQILKVTPIKKKAGE